MKLWRLLFCLNGGQLCRYGSVNYLSYNRCCYQNILYFFIVILVYYVPSYGRTCMRLVEWITCQRLVERCVLIPTCLRCLWREAYKYQKLNFLCVHHVYIQTTNTLINTLLSTKWTEREELFVVWYDVHEKRMRVKHL